MLNWMTSNKNEYTHIFIGRFYYKHFRKLFHITAYKHKSQMVEKKGSLATSAISKLFDRCNGKNKIICCHSYSFFVYLINSG